MVIRILPLVDEFCCYVLVLFGTSWQTMLRVWVNAKLLKTLNY